jgi:hypothetical protein
LKDLKRTHIDEAPNLLRGTKKPEKLVSALKLDNGNNARIKIECFRGRPVDPSLPRLNSDVISGKDGG